MENWLLHAPDWAFGLVIVSDITVFAIFLRLEVRSWRHA